MEGVETIGLTEADLDLLTEALDSHAYWQLSDECDRRSGYVILPEGCDQGECAADCENRENHQAVRDCDTLAALLRMGGRK